MKKILAFILMFSLLLSFNACSSDSDGNGEEKTFVWDGDWNDPSHPKYEEYQGKYNPIQGKWRRVDNKVIGYENTENFKINSLIFQSSTSNQHSSELVHEIYYINDKAFKYTQTSKTCTRYKIIENKLYAISQVIGQPLNNDDWIEYEKLEE